MGKNQKILGKKIFWKLTQLFHFCKICRIVQLRPIKLNPKTFLSELGPDFLNFFYQTFDNPIPPAISKKIIKFFFRIVPTKYNLSRLALELQKKLSFQNPNIRQQNKNNNFALLSTILPPKNVKFNRNQNQNEKLPF